MTKRWIQKAITKHRKGALHRQLQVPQDKRIPNSLLNRIKSAPIGATVKNPSATGKRRVKVTRLLKKRVVLAHTLRNLK